MEVRVLVHEWSVMATDWLLAAVCLWYARGHVARAFRVASAAALIGGLRHGIGPWLSEPVYVVLRVFSYSLIPPAVVLLYLGLVRTRASSRWVIAGTVMSVIAVAVQRGVPLGTHGTLHDDLFHLLMMPAVYAYYRAVFIFPEAPDAP